MMNNNKKSFMKTTSEKGLDLIKKSEGYSSKSYPDPGTKAAPYTAGWGSTRHIYGTPIKLGEIFTTEQATSMLQHDLKKFEDIINKKITIELNQNQFDALVCFTYNTGGSDTLFKLVNENNSTELKEWWPKHYITGGGKELKGLITRRAAEYALFISN